MAGRRGSIGTVATGRRVFLALCLVLCLVGTSAAEPQQVYDVDLRAQSVADALTALSEQTGAPVIFPYDLVKDRKSNPVIGHYTLLDALNALLKDTGLSGGLSDKGVLTISQAKSDAPQQRDANVTSDKKQSQRTNSSARPAGFAAFFASIAAAFSASAQTIGDDSSSSDGTKLESVVVSAQKKGEERLQDVPIPITAISAPQLLSYDETRVQDFASTVPGLIISPVGSDSQSTLSIRGIASGGTNPTVGVLVDDVPYGSITNYGTGNVVPDIDPNDLARVEVLRGPQGTIYGSSSMGGLLKFVTKDPSVDSFSGNVSAGVSGVHNGAEPGYNARASTNIPLADTLAMRASVFTREDPGYIDNPFLHVNGINEDHANGGRLALLWKPSEAFSVKLSGLYQDVKADGSSDVNSGPGYVNSLGAFQPGNPTGPLGDLQQDYYPGIAGFRGLGGYERTIQAYSAVIDAKLGSADLTSVTGFSVAHFNDSFDFTPDFAQPTEQTFGVAGTPVTDSVNTRKVTQELRLSGSLERLDWLFGGFFEHAHTTYIENIWAESVAGDIVGTWADWDSYVTDQEEAAFANLTYHFTERFDVQVGGRESHIVVTQNPNTQSGEFNIFIGSPYLTHSPEESTNANVFTYLFTPRFKLTQDVMAYARLASGYRPGESNGNTPVSSHVPAQADPDKTLNYELGLKGDFLGHQLSVDTSVYYIDWKDMQVQVVDPVTNFPYRSNAGGAKSEGVEFAVTARPLPGLSISTWVSYDEAVLTKDFPPGSQAYGLVGTRLPYSTRWSGYASFLQDFPLPGDLTGFVGGQVSIVGDRLGNFATNATTYRQDYPGYTEVDFRGGAKFNLWTVNLFVNNVSDRRGLLGGGAATYPPIGYQYITPRTVGVNVSKSF